MPSMGGYVKVPTFVVENLRLLTAAETAFTLIVLRRGSRATGFVPVAITDENWSKWSGLSARQKEYAIAGLRDKGLSMDGRGNSAKFSFDAGAFQAFTKRAVTDTEAEVRTKGRAKGVSVAAGTIVHETCRDKGCQMLCGGPEQSCTPVVVPLPSSVAAVAPVAPLAVVSPVGSVVPGANGRYTDLKLGRFPLVAAALKDCGFLTAGAPFVRSLVKKCLDAVWQKNNTFNRPAGPPDEVIAMAVRMAFAAKRGTQRAEGLFLQTVPPLLDAAAVEIAKLKQAVPVDVAPIKLGGRLASRLGEIETAFGVRCGDLIERLTSDDPDTVFAAFDETAVRLIDVAARDPRWAQTKQRFSHVRDEAVKIRCVVTELLELPGLNDSAASSA